VVLLDFGLVTDAHEAEAALMGTPGYMSPEQVSSSPGSSRRRAPGPGWHGQPAR
jgi:serine/threonine protein kinase